MASPSDEFRQQLLETQEVTPALREAYQAKLEALLNPPMTARSAFPGVILLVLLLGCVALVARAEFLYKVGTLMHVAWGVLAAACLFCSVLIVRDLQKRKHSRRSAASVAGALTIAAGTLTVVALIMGLHAPSDPKSLFGAFYVFVFYFACVAWSLDARIAAAELSAREQSLRIESRLADIVERLGK